jgi:hypothetical protein
MALAFLVNGVGAERSTGLGAKSIISTLLVVAHIAQDFAE